MVLVSRCVNVEGHGDNDDVDDDVDPKRRKVKPIPIQIINRCCHITKLCSLREERP